MGIIESIIVVLGLLGSLWGNYEQSGTIGELEAQKEIYEQRLKKCGSERPTKQSERLTSIAIEQHGDTTRKAIKQLKHDIRQTDTGDSEMDYAKCSWVLSPNAVTTFIRVNKAISRINKSATSVKLRTNKPKGN